MPVTTDKQQRRKEKGLGESLKQNRVLIQYMHIDINTMQVKKEKKKKAKQGQNSRGIIVHQLSVPSSRILTGRAFPP